MTEHFVITIANNELSNQAADRCIKSGAKYGVDIKKHKAITPHDNPEQLMKSKNIDPEAFKEMYSRHENCMAAFMSHYSLWEKCAFANTDFVIFEHDAVVVNNIPDTSALTYVGTIGKPSYGKYNTPSHLGWGPLTQKRYFGGAHAYIVKPAGAWALMEKAQQSAGPTDVFLHLDNFPWLQEWGQWSAEAKDSFTTIQKTQGCLAKHNYNKDLYVVENV